MKTTGNSVLITGGATGIGLTLAQTLLKLGNKVMICGRRESMLEEAKRKNPDLLTFRCDVSDDDDRRALLKSVLTELPDMNVLVNNAGIQRHVDLLGGESELEGFEDEIQINLAAPIYLSSMFIPHLVKKKNAAIVNVSSGLGFVPMAIFPVYCATKAALHSYTMSLRHQLADTGIKVFEAIPPMVVSELGQRPPEVNNRAMPTGDCVDEIICGLENDQFEIGIGYAENLCRISYEDAQDRFKQMNG